MTLFLLPNLPTGLKIFSGFFFFPKIFHFSFHTMLWRPQLCIRLSQGSLIFLVDIWYFWQCLFKTFSILSRTSVSLSVISWLSEWDSSFAGSSLLFHLLTNPLVWVLSLRQKEAHSSPGWPQTPSSPNSASQMLGLLRGSCLAWLICWFFDNSSLF